MATKIGEGYYEVYPEINQKAVAGARQLIGKQLSDQFAQTQAAMRKQQAQTAAEAVDGENEVASARDKNIKGATKSEKDFQATRISGSDDVVDQENKILGTRTRNTSKAKQAESDFSRTRSKDTKQASSDESLYGKLRDALAKKQAKDDKDHEGSLHRIATQFRTIGTIGKGIGLGVGAVSSFSVLQNALGGIIAAGPIAAAGIALLPPAIAAVGAEAIILKVAFKGVGDGVKAAFSNDSPKKFQAAIAGLAPSAQKFVTSLRAARGILPNIQQDFFSAPQLQQAAKNVQGFLKTITKNVGKLAKSNGGLIGGILGSVTGPEGAADINKFLGNISKLLVTITPGMSVLTTGFLDFLNHSSAILGGTGGRSINNFLVNFGKFLSNVNTKKIFHDAGVSIAGFGDILGHIGGTVVGIIHAFGGTDHLGAQFFKNIGGFFAEIDKFANSANGQKFLTQLVGTLNSLSSLADTVIKDGLGFLAGLFAGLYPAIKPFVDEVKKLVDDIFTPQFGHALGVAASNLLIIGTNILKYVEPAVKGLVDFLTAHPGVITGLAIAIGAVYTALKIAKGVSAIRGGIKSITDALNWFTGGLPKRAAVGMGEVAAGEDAMGAGAAEAGGAQGIRGLTASIIGKGGLIGALGLLYLKVSSPNLSTAQFIGDLQSVGDAIGELITGKNRKGKKVSSGTSLHDLYAALNSDGAGGSVINKKSFANSPFMKDFIDPIESALSTTTKHVKSFFNFLSNPSATGESENDFSFGQTSKNGGAIKAPSVPKGGVKPPSSGPGTPSTKAQQKALGNITPSSYAGQVKTLTSAFNGLNTAINKTTTTSATWAKNFPKNITAGIATSGGAAKTFPATFTTPIDRQFTVVDQHAASTWTNVNHATAVGIANVGKTVSTFPASYTAPIGHQYAVVAAGAKTNWTNINKDTSVGLSNVGKTVATMPAVYTRPIEAQYTTVQSKTTSSWKNINTSFTTGMHGVKTTVAQLPATFLTPARKTYNNVLAATAKTWTSIGKQFTLGVRNTGTASSQLINASSPGIKGLVTVYENNIKKVWDSIAGPLKLAKLTAVSYSGGSASAGKVSGAPAVPTINVATGGNLMDFRVGGRVNPGFGGKTQDNVPAVNVSGREYVVKGAVVQQPGVLSFLNALNFGNKRQYVGGDPSSARVTAHNFAGGGAVGESVPQVLSFLQSIAGRVPYVLGSNGPNAFDCSSLVGEVWARLTGHPNNRRYFTTGTENAFLLSHGFAPGGDPSGFTVGLTYHPDGHTVGILAGHRFEAAHTGTRMRYDDGAANAMNFPLKYHMIGGGGAFSGITDKQVAAVKAAAAKDIPGNSQFAGMLRAIPDQEIVPLQKVAAAAVQAQLAAFSGFGAGEALGNLGNSAIPTWIAEASKYANIPANWVPGIETIIRRESGGNPRAINRTDANARAGHPSQGLMQTIPSTFYANVPAALRSRGILDPVANIAAAVNYIHRRYGSIFNVQQANPNLPPRGYKEGGQVTPATPSFSPIVRDSGGPLNPGMNHVWNGTGKQEWVDTYKQHKDKSQHDVNVTVDFASAEAEKFVDVKIKKNNENLSRTLASNGRRGRR